MSANSDPSHFCSLYCVALSHSLYLTLAPSETLKMLLWSLFTIKNYIQVLTPVSVWRRALQGGSCSGCGCGVAACLWHSGWIREHSSVRQGCAPLQCHPGDLATLHCSASIWGAALHLTPPPPGAKLDVPLAFQSHCAVSWAKE